LFVRRNRQRLGYTRIVQLLVYLVIVPTTLILSVGIVLMFIGNIFNLLFGVLTVSFVLVVVTGVVLVLVFLRREANLSELQADFISKVSHELRTPLTSIRLFVETIGRSRGDTLTEDKCLDALARETDRECSWMFSAEHELARDVGYALVSQVLSAGDDRSRLAVVLSLEAIGREFFVRVPGSVASRSDLRGSSGVEGRTLSQALRYVTSGRPHWYGSAPASRTRYDRVGTPVAAKRLVVVRSGVGVGTAVVATFGCGLAVRRRRFVGGTRLSVVAWPGLTPIDRGGLASRTVREGSGFAAGAIIASLSVVACPGLTPIDRGGLASRTVREGPGFAAGAIIASLSVVACPGLTPIDRGGLAARTVLGGPGVASGAILASIPRAVGAGVPRKRKHVLPTLASGRPPSADHDGDRGHNEKTVVHQRSPLNSMTS
jgi:hypothetical protein